VAEAAIMDCWGNIRKEQLVQMIGTAFDSQPEPAAAEAAATDSTTSFSHIQPRSFYTLGMDSLENMITNVHFGLQYTSLIKIKCDDNVANLATVLSAIVPIILEKTNGSGLISIDANASWKHASIAHEFLHVLKPFAKHIAMIEQPFPLFRACPQYITPPPPPSDAASSISPPAAAAFDESSPAPIVQTYVNSAGEYVSLPDSILDEWSVVARVYADAGLVIYADESIVNARDMRMLLRCIHGINIKLEKAGGYRAALCLLVEAQKLKLSTWLGSMVGSSLCSAQVAHLLPFATPHCWGDLDGSLLTQESSDQFEGGMIWTRRGDGTIQMAQGYYGTACGRKK
jgi:L-alanine-DL-glutamate epimerase-like enolase superfamily enzyme